MSKTRRLFAVLMILSIMILGHHNYNVFALEEHETFVLLGVDARTEDKGRSDVIMILDLNKATGEATLASIPRDTYVEIPGHGLDKINHAYAFGGPELTQETINAWLGTDIKRHIAVDMEGLKAIMAAVGEVEVVPPTTFSIGGYNFVAGESVKLTPEMALAYARERYTSGGDYARQQRQRDVIKAVVEKMTKVTELPRVMDVFNTAHENMETNMSSFEILEAIREFQPKLSTVKTFQLTGTGERIDGIYYDIPDEQSVEELKALIGIE